MYAWAREWIAGEWAEWAPRTRDSLVEALARFLPLVVEARASEPPAGLRVHLRMTLVSGAVVDSADPLERWLSRWGLALGELDEALLADVERRLGIGDKGQQLAAATAGRYRKVARTCIRRAVALKKIPADPWPPTPRGRSQRKALRKRKAIDVRRLPSPEAMVEILEAIPSHQPGSRKYQVMTALTYYGGLRPSEVVMLRPSALLQPELEEEWGEIDVVEADDGYDESAEPKTGQRTAPAPPVLVCLLRDWIADNELGPDDLMFRTRTGRRPTLSNWNRTLKRACGEAGYEPMSPYDGRHACATTWLGEGVALGVAALWLGHSVETLVAFYVGALQGDEEVAKERVQRRLNQAGRRILPTPSPQTMAKRGQRRSKRAQTRKNPDQVK